MGKPVIIVGAGGHGRETAYTLLLSAPRDQFIGFLDDRARGSTPEGWPILGPIDTASSHAGAGFVVAINDPRIRRTIVHQLQAMGIHRWATVLHPQIKLHASVRLGVGCSILGGCQLTTNIRIGDHCIMNRGSQVSHDCEIGDFCSLNPGACMAGHARMGSGCEMGSLSAIRQGATIGSGCTVGMGSVVLESIPDNAVVVGNPARLLRSATPW